MADPSVEIHDGQRQKTPQPPPTPTPTTRKRPNDAMNDDASLADAPHISPTPSPSHNSDPSTPRARSKTSNRLLSANAAAVQTPGRPRDGATALHETEGAVDSGEEELSDPAEQLPRMDWEALEYQYHQAVRDQAEEEHRINDDLQRLLQLFNVWARTIEVHEVDRNFKRLKTRMAHVQHSETNLEKQRQHYQKIVRAFQSALDLLNEP